MKGKLSKYNMTNPELDDAIIKIKKFRKDETVTLRQISNILRFYYNKDISIQRIASRFKYSEKFIREKYVRI